MDFNLIIQAKQGLQKSQEQRHLQSSQLYEKGKQLVREALSPSINKHKLKQTVDCFSKGIQSNYKNASNYWGMGYLFLSLNQPLKSIPYIRSGLEIEPLSSLGQALMRQAQSGLIPVGKKSKFIAPEKDDDFEQLYEDTANALMRLLKELLAEPFCTAPPTLEPEILVKIKSKHDEYLARQTKLAKDIQVLDQEIDISDLEIHVATIQRKLKQLENSYSLQALFLEINSQIQNEMEAVNHLIEKVEGILSLNKTLSEDNEIQILMDRCDFIADRLDDLGSKNIEITILEQSYMKYVSRLELLQDLLEEN